MAETLPAKRRPRRGMYVLPSTFTAGNMAFGFYAMTQSLQGALYNNNECFDRAALAIGIAILFDSLDGRIARMTNTTSDFGKELDSLADVVTFGVAPAVLAYVWGVRMLPANVYPMLRERVSALAVVVCFLFLVCGACRLARFNISHNPQPRNPGRPGRKYFVGMPIPAGAGVLASVIHCYSGSPIHDPRISLIWLGLIAGVGFLMVSSWRFWSGKEIDFSGKHPFQLFVLLALVGGLVWKFSEYMLISIALAYLVSGVLARLAYRWERDHRLGAR
ncbi:CDP-diacylglycerol--serine O-phosphatidyltransferase [Granulicella rosea]|nr:CDP-diacylglycerol--serine O-phosphatidyltransferase [Granulicella rosea]